jgi:hypothetical protein
LVFLSTLNYDSRSTTHQIYGVYSPLFPLQNAVCFIILTYLVPVLFTFYIQSVLKLKKNNSGVKRLTQVKSNIIFTCFLCHYTKLLSCSILTSVFEFRRFITTRKVILYHRTVTNLQVLVRYNKNVENAQNQEFKLQKNGRR